jgi:hypothetical protein
VPLYAAQYQTACMTRQDLERLAAKVASAAGTCRPYRLFASLADGRLLWVFSGPDRATMTAWLASLHLGHYQWLARIDYEGENGTVRAV